MLAVKQFESVDEIDRAVAKITKRLEDVRGLDLSIHRWDGPEKKSVQENIRQTILSVYGESSPEYQDHGFHTISRGPHNFRAGDSGRQRSFEQGIGDTIVMLEGLIRRLEEEKEQFVPPKRQLSDPSPRRTAGQASIQIQGNVERIALGDMIEHNLTFVSILNSIGDAIKRAPEIPDHEKQPILDKLRSLAENPWIVGLGSGALLESIKAAIASAIG